MLTSCASRDPAVTSAATTPSGNWRIERAADRITGAPIASALLPAPAASNAKEPFPRPALLQLTCFRGQPIARFQFEFKIGSNTSASFAYRFDEKPGHEIKARFLQDSTTVVIENLGEVAQFVNELAASEVLFVQVRSLVVGRTAVEFKVDGAPAAIAAAFATCPLPAAAPPRARTS